jgi:hypothetical protein
MSANYKQVVCIGESVSGLASIRIVIALVAEWACIHKAIRIDQPSTIFDRVSYPTICNDQTPFPTPLTSTVATSKPSLEPLTGRQLPTLVLVRFNRLA